MAMCTFTSVYEFIYIPMDLIYANERMVCEVSKEYLANVYTEDTTLSSDEGVVSFHKSQTPEDSMFTRLPGLRL